MMEAPDGGLTVWQDGGVPGYTSLVVVAPHQRAAIVLLANVVDYAPGLGALANHLLPVLAPGAPRLP